MEKSGIHRITVDDGVELAGHVYGRGPAVVFVHGALEDGEKWWLEMTSHLSDRFCCYLMDLRGTGMSDDHPDLSPQRQVRDVVAFAESIGEPVGVVGESGGAMWTLGAAARSAAIATAAVYEPVVFEVATRQQAEAFDDEVSRMRELADDGRVVEAAEVFLKGAYTDDEWELVPRDYVEASGRYVEMQLREFEQIAQSDYSPTDPGVLKNIDVPLLLMHGERGDLADWLEASVHHIAEHVDNSQIRQFKSLSHAAPILQPKMLADEVRQFLDQTLPRGEAARSGRR